MIRAVKIGDKTGYLVAKSGLAIGAAFMGAVVMSAAIGWIALGNTNSLNQDNKKLVDKLEYQIMEAKEANCKLKLYDILSGRAGTLLFKKAHVINPFFEKGITHTLEIIESIPSNKNCTSIFKSPQKGNKKQTGGLTSSDIKYANEVLGEVLEEPRGLQHRQEEKVKKNTELRKKIPPNNNKIKKEESFDEFHGENNNTINSPPGPIAPTLPLTTLPSSSPDKEKTSIKEKCVIEINVLPNTDLGQELKICK